jgi:hypothetical protein
LPGSPFLADRERSLPVRAREQAVPFPRDQGPHRHDLVSWLSREAQAPEPTSPTGGKHLPPEMDGRTSYRGWKRGLSFVVCYFGRRMGLSFPELALRPSCMRGHRNNAWGFQASPGIRPVGAHLLTPMRVARAPQPRAVRAGTAAGRGTVTHGAEMPRGRGHRSTPLVAATADQALRNQTPLPTVP